MIKLCRDLNLGQKLFVLLKYLLDRRNAHNFAFEQGNAMIRCCEIN